MGFKIGKELVHLVSYTSQDFCGSTTSKNRTKLLEETTCSDCLTAYLDEMVYAKVMATKRERKIIGRMKELGIYIDGEAERMAITNAFDKDAQKQPVDESKGGGV